MPSELGQLTQLDQLWDAPSCHDALRVKCIDALSRATFAVVLLAAVRSPLAPAPGGPVCMRVCPRSLPCSHVALWRHAKPSSLPARTSALMLLPPDFPTPHSRALYASHLPQVCSGEPADWENTFRFRAAHVSQIHVRALRCDAPVSRLRALRCTARLKHYSDQAHRFTLLAPLRDPCAAQPSTAHRVRPLIVPRARNSPTTCVSFVVSVAGASTTTS